MEKAVAHGCQTGHRFGNRMAVVYVSLLEDGEEYVTASVAYNGSGSAMGVWRSGFVASELPTETERIYFCDTFGIDEAKFDAAGKSPRLRQSARPRGLLLLNVDTDHPARVMVRRQGDSGPAQSGTDLQNCSAPDVDAVDHRGNLIIATRRHVALAVDDLHPDVMGLDVFT